MTPRELDAMLAPEVGWRAAYATVEKLARLHLENNVLVGEAVPTNELVEAIYPQAQARGEQSVKARNRIFRALQALAAHGLAGYCHKGPERKTPLGNTIRPWLWHPIDTHGQSTKAERVLRAVEAISEFYVFFAHSLPPSAARDKLLQAINEARP